MDATHIIVFAKAPLPGLAKTRLIPALGAEGSARLAQKFLSHTVENSLAAAPGKVSLYCAPDSDDAAFRKLAEETGVSLAVQADVDLGGRMADALGAVLQAEARALLIGTDCPGLTVPVLHQAAQALRHADVVLVPALDGGYVLVGAVQARAAKLTAMFSDIAWSSPLVMQQTRQRLRTLGWTWIELAPLADIDEPADLVHLPAAYGKLTGIPGGTAT